MAAGGANFLKGVKLGGTRRAKELVPGVGAESGDAGEARLNVAELNGADQSGEVGGEGAQKRVSGLLLANAHNQKDRCARERTDDRLRKDDLV